MDKIKLDLPKQPCASFIPKDDIDREYGLCKLDVSTSGKTILPKFDKEVKLTAAEAEWAAKMKETFHKYDVDGDHAISLAELKALLTSISPDFSDKDVKTLFEEADQNENGWIEFDEFIDWVMQPARESLGKAVIGYAECFKVLFDVYDKEGVGSISKEVFEECHCVLQAALRLNPLDDDDTHRQDPLLLEKDHDEVFELVDQDGTGKITFLEFVDWMKDHIPKDMEKQELQKFLEDLATMLKSTFRHMTLAEEGYIPEEHVHVLREVIRNLAKAARTLDEGLKEKPKEAVKPQWSDPPIGLNVDRLKATHMGVVPLNMRRVDKVAWEVLCLPMPGEYDNPEERIWLAEIIRRVHYKSGKDVVEDPEYYVYDRKTFSWSPVCAGSTDRFQETLEELSPGIGVFCLLKTASNFGAKINWAAIQNALDGGVDMKFITEKDLVKFNEAMKAQAFGTLKYEGLIDSESAKAVQLKAAEDWLQSTFVAKPRVIMGMLSDLNIVEVDPAWIDYVDEKKRKTLAAA